MSISEWVSIHFDNRYEMHDSGKLRADEHGSICYFNDILDFLDTIPKELLEAE